MQLSIETFGESIVSRELLRFSERLVDATPAFEEIATEFYDSEKKQFDSQGGWGSGGWTPDQPATVAAKIAGGFDTRTLHRTLTLRLSLTTPDSEGSVKQIRPDEMVLGSSIAYGPFHQYGTERMPMRKPVELPESTKVEMVKTIQRYLIGRTWLPGGSGGGGR